MKLCNGTGWSNKDIKLTWQALCNNCPRLPLPSAPCPQTAPGNLFFIVLSFVPPLQGSTVPAGWVLTMSNVGLVVTWHCRWFLHQVVVGLLLVPGGAWHPSGQPGPVGEVQGSAGARLSLGRQPRRILPSLPLGPHCATQPPAFGHWQTSIRRITSFYKPMLPLPCQNIVAHCHYSSP